MRLRSPVFILLFLAFLLLFFLNTWQGNRYQTLLREVQSMELEQKSWLEKNKQVIAALAVLSSPDRIKSLAVSKLALKQLQAEETIKIELTGGEDD